MTGLWPFIVRGLAARKVRAALTVLAVGLGVAVMLGVQIGLDGLDSQSRSAARMRAGGSGLDVRTTANGGLTTEELTALSRLPGVIEVAPLHQKRVAARPARGGQALTVTLVGLRQGAAALRPIRVAQGRLPSPDSHDEIAVDAGLREALSGRGGRAALDDIVVLTTSRGEDTFRIVGFTTPGTISASFTRDAVFMSDAAVTGAFDLGLRTPLAGLRLAATTDSAAVAGAVRGALGKGVTTYDPGDRASQPLGQVAPLLLLITVLSLVIGAGVSANSVTISALERRRDLGLLRAAGASARLVFRLLVIEALALAVVGAMVGSLAGAGVGALLRANFASPDLPPPGHQVNLLAATLVAAVGVVAAVLAASVPAAAAARTPILEALRPEAAGRPTPRQRLILPTIIALLVLAGLASLFGSGIAVSVSLVSILLAVGLALPIIAPALAAALAVGLRPIWPEARLAAASIRRNRRRSRVTLSGLVVAVAGAVASSILIAGSLTTSDRWVGSLFVGEIVVRSSVTQPDVIAADISRAAGGVEVTPLRFFAGAVDNEVVGLAAIDSTVYAGRRGLDVVDGDRNQTLEELAGGLRVLAPVGLAADHGWQRGSRLILGTPVGATVFTVAGIVAHSFPAGDGRESLIIARAQARTQFGATAAGFDDLEVLTPGRSEAVAAAAARYGLSTVAVTTIQQRAREALGRSIGLLLGVAGIAIGIAMLGLINTLAVNIRQGTRELGLLRAVGLSRAQALRLRLAEAGLLALAAGVIGMLTGCLVALPMLRASSSPGFEPAFDVPAIILLVIGITIVAAAVIAVVLPARRAVGADIVNAVRHQ